MEIMLLVSWCHGAVAETGRVAVTTSTINVLYQHGTKLWATMQTWPLVPQPGFFLSTGILVLHIHARELKEQDEYIRVRLQVL